MTAVSAAQAGRARQVRRDRICVELPARKSSRSRARFFVRQKKAAALLGAAGAILRERNVIRGGRHPVETSSGAARQCHEKSYSQRDQIECDQAFEEGPDAVSERDVLDPADKQGNRQDERDRRVEVRDQSIAAASSIIAIQAAPITPSLE